MKRLRVCVVTGTRAEFGIWTPVLNAISRSKRLEVKLIVTGMHLLKEFGGTAKDVEAAFRVAACVPMYRKGEPAARSLARGIESLAAAYEHVGADLLMVLGDRLEMLAAASAALAQRLPIAHVHGGESAPGIWDEQIRHAITKMAHLHFCATKTAARRIKRMGEDPGRVHVTGAPALDVALEFARNMRRHLAKDRIDSRRIGGPRPTLLLHPSSTDETLEQTRANMIIDAMLSQFPGAKIHAIGPNNDPGHRGILRAYQERREYLWLEMSMPQAAFWRELFSGLLVGNSSSGVIEAATLGCAVVNIGERQANRERSDNVIDIPWNTGQKGIERALRFAVSNKPFHRRVAAGKNVYGDGRASQRIVRVLESIAREGKLSLEKQIRDG